ncbi:MAG: guanylate kinase [Thiomargarita sp.]|nr:guanylate kinase [Thiomargarita sp.]
MNVNQATLYIISAPSGAGKTSLVKELVNNTENLQVSVSHTTRQSRPGEQDGINYNFIDKTVFTQMQQNNDFLEYAKVFDYYYGTSKKWVEQKLNAGIDIILEIDWQGAQQVRKIKSSAVGIFILPPSQAVLKERLYNRGQDSEAVIQKRLQGAVLEISHYNEFDYLIVNDDFFTAVKKLQKIIYSQRLKQTVQAQKLALLVKDLLNI